MTPFTRAILRFLFGLFVWWILFFPAFEGIQNPVFFSAAISALLFQCVAFAFPKWSNAAAALFFAAILLMALSCQNRWLLPPMITGIFLVLAATILFRLNMPGLARISPTRPGTDKIPALRHLATFFTIWALGMAVIAIGPSVYAPVILVFWTCTMFILFNTISTRTTNTLWIGYKTRRDCFVPQRRWTVRIWTSILMVALCGALCAYAFIRT